MNRFKSLILLGALVICQSCVTQRLWDDANPAERVWIDADKITEESLKNRGVKYEVYSDERGKGYLIEKTGLQKMGDYHLRMLGTPVTLVLDGASSVAVVGVYLFLNDPKGTCNLIRAVSHH